MEEITPQCTPDCPECEKRAAEHRRSEDAGMALLIALMPLMTITLLNNMGLF